jgi:Galactosyltransferase
MNQSSDSSLFLKMIKKSAVKKQKYLFLIIVAVFITIFVFVQIQFEVKDVTRVKNRFEWLRNKNFLPLYVRPEENTAVFVPNSLNLNNERQFIACFVISAPKNKDIRAAVRQTWGKLIKPIFLIGQNDKETMLSVTQEAHTFDDIIIEDFVDSYVNLTIKTAFAMKNFLTHFKDSKYFFKIDDDAFLNVESLYELLKNAPEDSLIGQKESHSIPIRDENHRWYIPEFLFEEKVFPPYFVGLSYVIPGKSSSFEF